MNKISVTGSSKDLETVIDKLHELEVLDIEYYEGELETGSPLENSEDLSELLVDIRSLQSKLPEAEDSEDRNFSIDNLKEKIPEINAKIEEIEKEKGEIQRNISSISEEAKYFRKLKGVEVNYSDLEETENLDIFIGKLDLEKFEKNAPEGRYHIYQGKNAHILVYEKNVDKINNALKRTIEETYGKIDTELKGTPEQILKKLEDRKHKLKEERKQKKRELKELSKKWSGTLQSKEEFLTEKVEKAEAPINFATTKNAFIAQGWVPTERYREIKEELAEVTQGKVYVQKEETDEEPPVKHQNNKLVKPFEGMTDLIAVPRYNEIDPSFMLLLTFPLFFGLMIGDMGYGLSSALVFIAGARLVPEAADMFKALLWTSAATVLFGAIYGEMFGFQIYESPFYRADYWTEIFYLALGIGVAHINLGLLFGAYNEYVNHGLLEAVYAKLSWILLQVAAVGGYLAFGAFGDTAGTAIAMGLGIPAIAMIYKGEGVEGVVEIPSLVSNIISYLRIFGVCMAAYTLAGTANAIAAPGLTSGTIVGVVSGIFILVAAHTMLTFIKILEGAIQGIRLHYVEMFGWFYEGGGKKYAPFGAKSS